MKKSGETLQDALLAAVRGAYKIQKALYRQSRHLDNFLGGFAIACFDTRRLARFTAAQYGAMNLYNESGIFEWEREWLEADLPPAPARILLGGAGTGRETRFLSGRGYSITGFDPIEKAVERARGLAGGKPTEIYLVGSYEQLADPKTEKDRAFSEYIQSLSPFDAVLLGWGSFTHIVTYDLRLMTLKRCMELCPHGPLLLSYWARFGDQQASVSRAARLGMRIGAAAAGFRRELDENDTVVASGFGHTFTKGEIEQLAEKAGYTVAMITNHVYAHATLRPKASIRQKRERRHTGGSRRN
jgi:hypothetical protein